MKNVENIKHYCRYCSHCSGYDEDMGWCSEKNMEVKKTSVRNACDSFDFCEIDAFYYNRTDNPYEAKYKPREKKKHNQNYCDGQMSFL